MNTREALPTDARAALTTFLSHPSPILLAVLLVGASALRVQLGPLTWIDAVIPLALLLAWPVYEWIIHVTVLHFRPMPIGRRVIDLKVARIHRDHHRDPWHLPDTFIPLHLFPLTLPLLLAPYLLFPAPGVTTFLVAYIALSLHYEWCHYLAHIHWEPPLRYWRRRVKKHRLHHFQNERLWWGVSTGIGDALLHTDPEPGGANKSPTTHDVLEGLKR